MVPAQPDGGPQPLVGERRRHADVDHGHVGGIGGDRLLQAGGVADRAGHGEAPVREELDQPVAQDGGVLGDHDPYGVGVCHVRRQDVRHGRAGRR